MALIDLTQTSSSLPPSAASSFLDQPSGRPNQQTLKRRLDFSDDHDVPSSSPFIQPAAISKPMFRPSYAIPQQLLDHVVIYLEEKLYMQALTLLFNLLISGPGFLKGVPSDDASSEIYPCYVPPPQILSLIATIATHPLFTQSKEEGRQEAANLALDYLQHVNALAGSQGANIGSAYLFESQVEHGRGKRRKVAPSEGYSAKAYFDRHGVPALTSTREERRKIAPRDNEDEKFKATGIRVTQYYSEGDEDDENDRRRIKLKFAEKESLWRSARGFWHLVGWSFNCASCGKYRPRWDNCWRRWLLHMLDTLEADWNARSREAQEIKETGERDATEKAQGVLEDALAADYLDETELQGDSGIKRIMRAVLADGRDKPVAEFDEVFRNEKKTVEEEVKTEAAMRPQKHVDLDQDDFGDYSGADEDDYISDETPVKDEVDKFRVSARLRQPKTSRRTSARHTPASGMDQDTEMSDVHEDFSAPTSIQAMIEAYGGIEALMMRRRLLVLLTHLAASVPQAFVGLETLLDLYDDFIRPLPIPIFALFISYRAPLTGPLGSVLSKDAAFSPHVHCTLLLSMLRPLLATSGTQRPRDQGLTLESFAARYLPFAAHTGKATDNARISLIFETLFRLLRDYEKEHNVNTLSQATARQRFRAALDSGIKARQGRKRSRGIKNAENIMALEWLEGSSARLRCMTDLIESESDGMEDESAEDDEGKPQETEEEPTEETPEGHGDAMDTANTRTEDDDSLTSSLTPAHSSYDVSVAHQASLPAPIPAPIPASTTAPVSVPMKSTTPASIRKNDLETDSTFSYFPPAEANQFKLNNAKTKQINFKEHIYSPVLRPSTDIAVHLGTLSEPQRSASWLGACFEIDEGREHSTYQHEIFNEYKRLFGFSLDSKASLIQNMKSLYDVRTVSSPFGSTKHELSGLVGRRTPVDPRSLNCRKQRVAYSMPNTPYHDVLFQYSFWNVSIPGKLNPRPVANSSARLAGHKPSTQQPSTQQVPGQSFANQPPTVPSTRSAQYFAPSYSYNIPASNPPQPHPPPHPQQPYYDSLFAQQQPPSQYPPRQQTSHERWPQSQPQQDSQSQPPAQQQLKYKQTFSMTQPPPRSQSQSHSVSKARAPPSSQSASTAMSAKTASQPAPRATAAATVANPSANKPATASQLSPRSARSLWARGSQIDPIELSDSSEADDGQATASQAPPVKVERKSPDKALKQSASTKNEAQPSLPKALDGFGRAVVGSSQPVGRTTSLQKKGSGSAGWTGWANPKSAGSGGASASSQPVGAKDGSGKVKARTPVRPRTEFKMPEF